MKKLLLITGLAALLLTACSQPTCAELTVEYRAAVDSINEEWDDAAEIADSTARMSLSGPVGELQKINRDTKRLEPPECAEGAHKMLTSYQESTIDGFLAFMAQEEDMIDRHFRNAGEFQSAWAKAYFELTEETE